MTNPTNDRDRRLAEIARIAVTLEAETGLPARLTIAQWATESSWGAEPVGRFNVFGMKKAARHTKSVWIDTHEIENGVSVPKRKEFADYDSLEESARDYAQLITTGAPYARAWATYKAGGSFTALAKAVLSAYATAQYGALALEIAGQNNVGRAIDDARAA